MNGSLVADLGIGPEVWLFATLLLCVTFFFKFGRFWSVRNLDLLLVFALAPGMMMLVGHHHGAAWWPFVWLFVGSLLWLVRCFVDLGLTRRPLLEPNLDASGLTCLAIGVIGLFVVETVSLPIDDGSKRNPADTKSDLVPEPAPGEAVVDRVLHNSPLAASFNRGEKARVILRRVLASLAQVGLVIGLIAVGWKHFDRPIAGLSVATCYLLLPYARFALTDSGQLIPAALIVTALVVYTKPWLAGLLIGLAAGWMPACIGLVPLWAGFYRRRGFWWFSGVAVGVVAACCLLGLTVPGLDTWARALGARSLAEAGLLPGVEAPTSGSFWSGIDPSYRLPVLIAYFALVIATTLLPASKNLGELIALSAALLVASQFWYLDAGGTLIVLYLPLLILMMFRPNLHTKRIQARGLRGSGRVQTTLFTGL
ncbi:hypothetical protein P12x_004739 [Tundrisphaera lichenicola]|uniref:hypothetical protein n=1 Tax=Tundrisphaera lichenicola TaxID=2029860 RepID=UPI003EBD38AB